jgi:hypothetical protein
MNTTRTKHLFGLSLLLFLSVGQHVNGQTKERRTFFPINGNTAFIDINGQVVIRASQPELLAEVHRVSSSLGRFRGPHEETTWIRFDEFSEGLAAAGWPLCPMCRNPQWVSGFIDATGRLVIPPKGSNARYGSFHEGLTQYSDKGWGFIDRTGRIVIPARFHDASDFSEGLSFVRLTEKSKFGCINKKGAIVIPYQFVWASAFHEGLAAVLLSKGKPGFIDKRGRMVLHSRQWLEVSDFSEGLASVQIEVIDNSIYRGYKDQKYGFIDRTGKFVIPPRFYRVQKFSEGRALFVQTGKSHGYGFIDSKGQVVIKPEFIDAKSFSEGLAAVAINAGDDKKLWGYINRDGTWIIRPQFQHVNSFEGGLAAVNCDEYGGNCRAYVDTAGKLRWQQE